MSGKKNKLLRRKVKNIMEKNKIHVSTFKTRMRIAKKAVKAGTITICAMFLLSTAHADKLGILQGANPLILQHKLSEQNIKLDFDFRDKTPESWGILAFDDKGMCINTYESIDLESNILNIVQQAVWDSMDKEW